MAYNRQNCVGSVSEDSVIINIKLNVKRVGNLYSSICAEDNIELADNKARKGKRNRYGVKKHDKYRAIDNFILYLSLRD